jgi:hypothetical protein
MKSLFGFGSVLLLLVSATGGCFEDKVVGENPADGGADAGGGGQACNADSDCATGEGCAYASADACSATGQCVSMAQVVCEAYSAGCACDGTEINIACTPYPQGFVSKPLAHDGVCESTTDDGGGACITIDTPAPGQCNTDSDCALVATGTICSDSCACPTVPANATEATAIQQKIGAVDPRGECACPIALTPTCSGGVCVSGSLDDAGAPDDAGACVTVDMPAPGECNTDSDCTLVPTGTFCSDSCVCPTVPGNNAQATSIQQQIASVNPQGECACPIAETSRCSGGVCAAGSLVDGGP